MGHPQRQGARQQFCWCDGAHGPLNYFPLLAACQWAGLPPSPGAGWPKIFHLCPHKEELSVTFCHRGNCVQAALGMTCCESCEVAASAYREKKKKQNHQKPAKPQSCSLFMAIAQWPFLLPSPSHRKGDFVLLFIGRQQLLP